jgi:predicted DNA-binding transcriptional regulator AlpA
MENHATPNPATVAALEKVPHAARRMGISISQCYREIKAQRIGPLVKLGERASALPAESVDRWIAARIAEATKAGGGK